MLLLSGLLSAEPAPLSGSAQLHELLDHLNTVGTVLMLGAHPDDENTAVMAYLARGQHLRTVYFSATRGEGGQNRIGPEQGALMGVIRTHELLEARRIDGGEQEFGSVVDFGYSKTPEETLGLWGRQQLLHDMVRVIRSVRPDVIVSRFPPRPGSGGHGHHTAVGWTGPLAWEAAADGSQFGDLGLEPWRAHRYVYNVPTFSRRMEAAAASQPGRLRLELGAYDPVLGKSYAELAGESRSMHRSQAMGTGQRKGSVPAFFEHVAGERATGSLLDGIDVTWARVPGGGPVGESLRAAREGYDPRRPTAILPHLLAALRDLQELPSPEAAHKRKELLRAIELASGLWIDASAAHWNAIPGGELEVTLQVLRRSDAAWEWRGARLHGVAEGAVTERVPLEENRPVQREVTVRVSADACYSQPHWLRDTAEGAPGCPGTAATPGPTPALLATFEFATPEGVDVVLEKPVLYRWIDSSLGERSRGVVIVPPVSVAFTRENRIFTGSEATQIPVRLSSSVGGVEAIVRVDAPPGWSVDPADRTVRLERRGQERTVTFDLTPPASASGGQLAATVSVGGVESRAGLRTIEYGHIPITPVFPRATMRVERLDARLLADEVGYVMGAGDKVPDALEQLGATVTALSAQDLASGDLSRFDAIVTGVRALNTRPDLLAARERVLAYVEQGGTLVVQYNTSGFGRRGGRAAAATLGPYPMSPSRLRVTDENAPVRFVSADHRLLTVPNRITKADFEGWVQERGLYFMSEWDGRYETVLACADPGEDEVEGGMLYARHGRGVYVFTGYSWFRQLPAGVPGAYRLFANLISAGKAR